MSDVAKSVYVQAKKLHDQKKWQEAKRVYKYIIEAFPDSEQALKAEEQILRLESEREMPARPTFWLTAEDIARRQSPARRRSNTLVWHPFLQVLSVFVVIGCIFVVALMFYSQSVMQPNSTQTELDNSRSVEVYPAPNEREVTVSDPYPSSRQTDSVGTNSVQETPLDCDDLTQKNLRGCDLSGMSLVSKDLVGVNLAGANLSGVNLTFARLTGANLAGANLEGAILDLANLQGVNLTSANLAEASFTRATLNGADFTRANLTGANLSGLDLTGVTLTDAYLVGANLSYVHLEGQDLTTVLFTDVMEVSSGSYQSTPLLLPANLAFADLSDSNLTGVDLRKANLQGVNLTRSNLTETNLVNALLVEADLTDVEAVQSDLTRADLNHANLTRANLTGAILIYTKLEGAHLACRTHYVCWESWHSL